eukprot:TRINITY_DN102309_c0_g1_i1.p1 TRINITY_DN102309_c0_g1~~TRINITY_DN102309_c0_g1_i1.p1  ORF type:complete len:390 (-),score=59.22 TRINITY_DN102309_c0_g1_i1:114-1283(-)
MDVAFEALNLAQSTFYHRNELRWAEIDYYLQVRQVHIDTLNNLREDLRDLYQMHKGKLDNSMIVATLMLSIGFGFVVEGTFPPEGPVKGPWEATLRVVYACVAGLALVCPFWSMLCLMECRRRLDYFMDRFTHEFYEKLKDRCERFIDDSSSAAKITGSVVKHTFDLPRAVPSASDLCPKRACDEGQNKSWFRCAHRAPPPARVERAPPATPIRPGDSAGFLATAGQPLLPLSASGDSTEAAGGFGGAASPRVRYNNSAPSEVGQDMRLVFQLHEDYNDWWDTWCFGVYRLSKLFHWGSILFNVGCCAILLGLYFAENYKETPWMWKSYTGVVCLGLAVAMPSAVAFHYWGPTFSRDAAKKPSWMLRKQKFHRHGPLAEPVLPMCLRCI